MIMNILNSLMSQYPNLLTEEIYDAKVKYPLEGYLFPATYSFYRRSIQLLKKSLLLCWIKQNPFWMNIMIQIEEKEMSVHQLLTLASLIEEEATEKVDRNQIASVFYNRMNTGMPLQTDPTVLYAKGEHQAKVLLQGFGN